MSDLPSTTAQQILLAGDVGGTNTRLALYEPEGDFDSTERPSRSLYKYPLFLKEYRNEETLGRGCKNTAYSIAASSNNESNDCCNDTVENFVQTMIVPFLDEASKTMKANQMQISWSDVTIVACLGIAGPVDTSRNNGTVTTSQRDYLVGLNGTGIVQAYRRLQEHTAVLQSCVIINDFVAQGYGCLSLSSLEDSGELYHLHGQGKTNPTGPKFCLGAGTGFGSCYMVPISSNHNHSCAIEYTCLPSEYGQSDWAPPTGDSETNQTQKDLFEIWNFLQQRPSPNQWFPHISVEDVVSGTGLATSYECLASLNPELANENVYKKFQSQQDLRGKVVGENVNRCKICERSVEAVMCAYGSVVGSCAMSFLPKGGLYVTGGLLLNVLRQELSNAEMDASCGTNEHERDENLLRFLCSERSHLLGLFLESYQCKGPASFLLNEIPLSIVLAKDAGLRGAAVRAEMVRFE